MATLIDPTTFRTVVETDLTDPALQLLLDDADAEIIRRLGNIADQTLVQPSTGELYFWLPRRATAITSIVERVFVGWGNPTEFNLQANDYKLHADGYRLERTPAGTNPSTAWRGVCTIVFTPFDDTASRKRLEIDLVKLALQYDAMNSSRVGDVQTQSLADYQGERERLFRSLASGNRRMIV